MIKRLTALLLVVAIVVSMIVMATPVAAASISDYPAVNVRIRSETPHTYLDVRSGDSTWPLSARIWSYATADAAIEGPAYCMNHNEGYPSGYIPVNTTPYTANPTMTAAFANGYPLVPLGNFTMLHPETSGLTEDEFGYATQVAIWAALSQLGVEGTSFTGGSETVIRPTDPDKLRVYNAVVAILTSASGGSGSGGSTSVGIRIRAGAGSDSDTVDLGSELSIAAAALTNAEGIQTESIAGRQYYTREYVLISSSMPASGMVPITISGGPAGTVLANASGDTATNGWLALSASGSEYSATFRICVPTDAAGVDSPGSVTVTASATVDSYIFYMVENGHANEQDFIIADSGSATSTASGSLIWGESETIVSPPAVTDPPETSPEPTPTPTTTPTPAPTPTPTPTPEPDPGTFRLHKQDAQSGFSLEGAVFRFEQIDGSFVTEGRTGADGLIVFTPETLPNGSYRVSELSAPEGYEKDNEVKTVTWDGTTDVDLYFTNVRKPGFKILKLDADTNFPLSGAYFDIFKDGQLIDTVRTNEQGLATVSGLSEGYYEAVEKIAPAGYVISTER